MSLTAYISVLAFLGYHNDVYSTEVEVKGETKVLGGLS